MNSASSRERLLDLLADRALVGLEEPDDDELGRLLVAFPDGEHIARDVELAAAAVALANLGPIAPLPSGLLERIEADSIDLLPTRVHRVPELIAAASAFRGDVASGSTPMDTLATTRPPVAPPPAATGSLPASPGAIPAARARPSGQLGPHAMPSQPPPAYVPHRHPSLPPAILTPPHPHSPAGGIPTARSRPLPTSSGRALIAIAVAGWGLALICLILGAGFWYLRVRPTITSDTNRPQAPVVPTETPREAPPTPPQAAAPTPSAAPAPVRPSAERTRLLGRPGTVRVDWLKAKDASGRQASGDVVWNAGEQRGYARVRGLARNDRRVASYQLWITDHDRDEKYPVDGGAFDVDDESEELVVPIQPKLFVGTASAFSITVERPGGVVVSKRDHVALTAKVPL
jgi:hypothetical protein